MQRFMELTWLAFNKLLTYLISYLFCCVHAGNDNIYYLTAYKRQILRIELTDNENNKAHAEYDNFKVDSEKNEYRLISVGTYSGTAGWRMLRLNT